jgi:hypothetical protein
MIKRGTFEAGPLFFFGYFPWQNGYFIRQVCLHLGYEYWRVPVGYERFSVVPSKRQTSDGKTAPILLILDFFLS